VKDINKSKIIQLDGLRGFAVLLIIIWHYGNNELSNNTTHFANYFKLATSYAWSGVDLFFVLSGFLLGGILIKNKTSESYFKTFYIRRICRIFPIYFLSLLLILAIIFSGYGQTTEWGKTEGVPFWSYFTFTQNVFMGIHSTLGNRWLSHTWSLALEEQFYLILPLLIYFLNTRALLIVLSIAIAASPIFRYYSNNWYEAFNFLYCRFDALFTGVICAYLFQNEHSKAFIVRKRKLLELFLIFFSLVIILLSIKKITTPYYLENSLLSITYCILLLIILTNENKIFSNLFSNVILTKIGVISFGLYLFHQPVSGLVHYFFFQHEPQINSYAQLIATAFSLAISIVLAGLSYRFIEKPIINRGHKYEY
jgi:peptidoglycan/LPS O-acetylase OafA/YrhL